MQMNQEKINFPVVRDFSELFNVSVKFVSQNFKHFFQSMLFIAGPFLLISSLCGALYQAYVMDTMSMDQQVVNYLEVFRQFLDWKYFLILLVAIFGRIVLLTTAYAYVIAYNEYGPKNFGVPEVGKLVFQNVGKTTKGFFICTLMIIFFSVIALAMIGLTATVLPIINVNPIITSVFVVIIFIAIFLVSPPFVWQFTTFYLVQMKDDLGVLDAMRRVREVMRGNFLSTWLVMVATGLILSVLTVFFMAPQLIYQFILQFGGLKSAQNSIPFLIVSTTCGFLVKFVASLFFIINSFLYYSLNEKKYGAALISRIDEIGNTPLNDVDQHY
jgi:hypothetical protein